MYNIVSIDPSLISTAVVVSSNKSLKLFNYCKESNANGKKELKKWYKLAQDFVNYRFINYREFDNYSDGELIKLKDYDKITDDIIDDILSNINKDIPTKVGIEGFSYSSTGDIIDLVTFSTLLRKKIYDKVSKDILVISPSSLKLESCKSTYKPIDVGKKKEILEWRNNQGISGGSFDKTHMYLSIIENDNYNDFWSTHCKSIRDELLSTKIINKPYEDLNDAYILYKIIEQKINI